MAKRNNKNSNRNKWLLVIAAFILLFLFLFNALPTKTLAPTTLHQTANSETADWQTYNNKGYSLKYPDSFTPQTTDWGIILNKDDEELTVGVNGGITLPEINPAKTEQVQFAGQNAEKRTYETDSGEVSGVYYLFEKQGNHYVMGYGLKGNFFQAAIPQEDIKTLDQMLSTFKFIQ